MTSQNLKTQKFSELTSKIEGEDLGEMKKVWRETAASEVRLTLLSEMKGKNLGFNEVEKYSIGLGYNFKSERMKMNQEKPNGKVI